MLSNNARIAIARVIEILRRAEASGQRWEFEETTETEERPAGQYIDVVPTGGITITLSISEPKSMELVPWAGESVGVC